MQVNPFRVAKCVRIAGVGRVCFLHKLQSAQRLSELMRSNLVPAGALDGVTSGTFRGTSLLFEVRKVDLNSLRADLAVHVRVQVRQHCLNCCKLILSLLGHESRSLRRPCLVCCHLKVLLQLRLYLFVLSPISQERAEAEAVQLAGDLVQLDMCKCILARLQPVSLDTLLCGNLFVCAVLYCPQQCLPTRIVDYPFLKRLTYSMQSRNLSPPCRSLHCHILTCGQLR